MGLSLLLALLGLGVAESPAHLQLRPYYQRRRTRLIEPDETNGTRCRQLTLFQISCSTLAAKIAFNSRRFSSAILSPIRVRVTPSNRRGSARQCQAPRPPVEMLVRVRGVHGIGCTWHRVCMASGVHGIGCAWHRVSAQF